MNWLQVLSCLLVFANVVIVVLIVRVNRDTRKIQAETDRVLLRTRKQLADMYDSHTAAAEERMP